MRKSSISREWSIQTAVISPFHEFQDFIIGKESYEKGIVSVATEVLKRFW